MALPAEGSARRRGGGSIAVREAVESDREAWDGFIASRPEADVLQSWAWGVAGSVEPGETWTRLIVSGTDGRVRGTAQLLTRHTSFGRQIGYVPHGPVWDRDAQDAPDVLSALLSGIRAAARSRRGVVVKVDPRADETHGAAEIGTLLEAQGLARSRHDLQARTTRVVELPSDAATLAAGWSADARAEVRRAGREGVTTRTIGGPDPGALDAFHALLSETSGRAGFRIRSREFLGQLERACSEADGWCLALAEADGRPIAGAIAPHVGGRAFYLYAASTRDPGMSRKRGAYAAMAALMTALASAGATSLDLWGVREPDDPVSDPAWEGFSLFKRRFGGRSLEHPGTFDLVVDPFWHAVRELRERLRRDQP
jgi:peptidoglycan pentaglycine glycine transferase (the first glycine)